MHNNIIKYCNRPYTDATEMTEDIIQRHNRKVGPNDIWYHLGDFAFGGIDNVKKYLPRMNGRKTFIRGNHDNPQSFHGLVENFCRDWVGKVGSLRLHMYHFPIESWENARRGVVHLHGHSHGGTNSDKLLRFDMGIDCFNMDPVSLEELEVLVNAKKEILRNMDLDPSRKNHNYTE